MSRADFDFESSLAPIILWYAQRQGLDVGPLAKAHSLPLEALKAGLGKQTFITSVSVVTGLMAELAQRLGDPHVGLSMAEAVPRGTYGVAEFLIYASDQLRVCFTNLSRYSSIFAPGQSFRYEETSEGGRLEHFCTMRPGALGRHLNEYTASIIARGILSMVPGATFERVWFTSERPPSLERLVAVFGETRFDFEAPTNGFGVSPQLADRRVESGDAALYAFLEEHAQAALESRPKQDDVVDTLRHAIREALKTGEPNIERLASRLNTSARTLQRRLADLKTTFQEVLDDVRFDLSRVYLNDARLELGQIAYLLGYSELRAFDRAFRRWSGQSPGEWRRG
jgi:AraC-like DNA-binding protein